MTDVTYTEDELREFDRITSMLAHPHQMVRLDARLTLLPKFIKEHGKEKCDAMFRVLQERDAKRGKQK